MTDRLRERSTAALFAWASALFAAPPSAATVAEHSEGAGAELLDSLAGEPDFAAGAAAMRAAVAGPDRGETLRRLQHAYAMGLEGAAGRASAPPYESAYSGSGRLYQTAAGEMQTLLDSAGLAPVARFHEPPDHIAIELGLAAYWLQSGNESASDMARRLADWTPRFAEACGRVDFTGFWAGAAQIVAALARRECGADAGSFADVR